MGPNEIALKCISQKEVIYKDLRDNLFFLNSLNYFVTVWSFLYRAEWLKNTGISFDTMQKHGGEDFDFNIKLIPYIKCMVVLPDILYLHFIRGNLSTSAKMYDDVMLHFLSTQKMVNEAATIIGCNVKKQVDSFIKYYGQCILNFISGAIRLNKQNDYIIRNVNDFRKYDMVKNVGLYKIVQSFMKNPKEALLYLLAKYHLTSFIIILYKTFR